MRGSASTYMGASPVFSKPYLDISHESNGPGPHLTGRRSTIGWDGRLLHACNQEDAVGTSEVI